MRLSKLAIGLAAIAFSLPAGAQTVTLKFASFEPPQAPFTATIFNGWAKDVTAASNGTLKVDVFAGGTLGRNPLQQFKLVQDGVADIAWTVAGYTPGRFDDTEVAELPFVVQNSLEASLALTRLAARNELVGFADLKLLLIGAVPPVSIHSKTAIKTIADLKGKRIRVGSPVAGKIAEAFGGAPVVIGAPLTAEALAKGVVDATFAEGVFVGAFKIDEVTSHHLRMPLGATAVMIPMLKSRYDSLPPAAKAAIDKYSGEALARRFGAFADETSNGTLDRVAKQPKNTMVVADAATLDQFRKATEPVTAAWRAQKPRNEYVYKQMTAELARIRSGK